MVGNGIRVLVADDHTLFRDGLVSLINGWDGFTIVGSAASGEEAVAACRPLKPDLVLMDVRMPAMGGVEATRLITTSFPQVQVVMLTMSTEEEDLFAALRNGARGYVLKDVGWSLLREFVTGVMRGEAAFSGSIAAKMLAELDGRTPKGASDPSPAVETVLTPREVDIMRLLVDGTSNAEIGQALHLSEQTIKKDLGRVMEKLHVKNRVQAAVYSVRQRLL